MNHNGSTETWLERHLLPGPVVLVVLITREELRGKLRLLDLVLVGSILCLLLSGIFSLVLKVETNGGVEVDLDGTALVLSLKSIVDLDVNLGSIEGTISLVDGPGFAVVVEGILEGLFSLVPHGLRTESVLGSRRQLHLVGEAEDGVNVLKEIHNILDLALDLLRSAENVSVILLESTHSDETAQGAGDFVSVKNTEVGPTDG